MSMGKGMLPMLLVTASIIISIVSYPSLPDTVATHWGINGEPDGYSSKLVAVSIMPALMILLYGASRIIPKVDPNKANYARFKPEIDAILNVLLLSLAVIHALIIAYAYGYLMKISAIAPVIVGTLFLVMGNYMPRFQHNYFIGIRTPWTLSDEQVWRRTHRFSSRVFFASGLVLLAVPLMPMPVQVPVLLTVVLAAIVLPIASSYYFYKNK